MKKIISLLLTVTTICTLAIRTPVLAEEGTQKDNTKIVIVHTNDAHCQIDKVDNDDPLKAYIGYECVAEQKKEEEAIYSNVSLVDAGDHIQGKPVGVLTKGEDIIKIMNAAGYDASTIGNHEFDYGVDRLKELVNMAEYPYVSCNFMDLTTGKTVFDPYYIESYETSQGTKKVAYVGVTTPESITKSTPKYFQDKDGNYIYGFCQDDTGEKLYTQVQNAVDSARNEGADYVVIVGHLGQDGVTNIWRSDTIVKNTTGVDAVVDGHSHEKYIQYVQNKEGKDVLISQTGTLLNAVGVMTIDVETGKVTGEVKQAPIASDEYTASVVKEVDQSLEEVLKKKVAESQVDLYVFEDDNFTWKVRKNETNMADLVADAYRTILGADVGIIGGGSIRANISKGTVTYNDLLSVQPFGNDTGVIKATGQQILNCLEMGARKYPESNGGFIQVSGITYKIDTSIPSSVNADENGMFVSVDGEYRVWDVKINGEALDLNKTYTVASTTYYTQKSGDGMSMFEGCETVVQTGPKDVDVLTQYVQENLNGVIGTEYEGKDGQGRIQFVTKSKDLSSANVVLSKDTFVYDTKEQKPGITVTLNDKELEMDKDYTVSYENNVNAGEAKVIIQGTGNYQGSVTKTFTIQKAEYKLENVEFKDATYKYDGKTHSLEAKNVPNEITVTYENNSQNKIGKYEVIAHFAFKDSTKNNNYTIADKKATLTINKTSQTSNTSVHTMIPLYISLFFISLGICIVFFKKKMN